ncbi:TonB-dependent receptor [Flavobacterium sp. ANB]|uniref:TonB-dependent receptor n=1 Tax=unclassified Flavobacterium TaxID=196869 RepID=UPI0012B76E00|nr:MULTISPECIES: TonB-dependent receptor [unclassified Flavobacterium]MBF4516966.1 TonB-dependent receptor [Flavobacterium sp. ANB]MTD69138.1 TonB-dependent receptor plug domain-containing protein [Flavobacterium sp. LC2016-13]
MPRFLLCFLVSVLASITSVYAQSTGNISGQILLVDGQPFTSASVSIIELNKSTLTDEKGNYSFKNVPAATYHIKIQVLGAAEQIIETTVASGQTVTVDYQLPKENVMALQEVTVSGTVNRFSKKESKYVARLPLKNLENPQVYNTVSKELILEQSAVDLASVSKSVPGAGIPMIANQGRVTFRSRGFETEPNARNGVAGAVFATIDPVNLERLEAIKGPSATLFGASVSSSYGGVYNRVTKKPYNDFGGEVAYTGGSYNFNRLTVDVNTPVNDDKTALFRLNGASTQQKSFQDLGFTKNITIAPSFSYQINDRLSLLLDVEFGKEEGTSVVRFNPFNKSGKSLSIVDIAFPYERTFMSNDLVYNTQMLNIFGQINYKISDEWTSQTIFSRTRSTIDGNITAINALSDTTARVQVISGNTNFIATDIQQNFIGDFKIGKFRNRMVVGLDYYNNYNDFDRLTINTPTFDFINPPANAGANLQMVNAIAQSGTGYTLRKEKNRDNTYAAYVSDVFNVTDRLSTMLSLRVDRYEYLGVYNIATGVTAGGLGANGTSAGPYNQTSLSQKLGLVYELSKDHLSLFTNYINGFLNKSGQALDGTAFKPEHANQLEFGVKGDVFNHRLVGTLSYYDIQVANSLRQDPTDATYSIQDGTQRSRGFEAEFTANPFSGFNVIAGYAYNDSEYTKADATVNGRRPALSGPATTVNFWLSYRIPEGKFQGLGAGFGGNYGTMSYVVNTETPTTTGTQINQVTIPEYTLLDAALYYDQPKYRISFKVNNLTSEKTWNVRLTPQTPAQFLGSFALKF